MVPPSLGSLECRQEMPDKATSKQVAQWQPGGSPKLDALVADLVRDFHLPNPFQAGLCRGDAKGAAEVGDGVLCMALVIKSLRDEDLWQLGRKDEDL